MQIFSEKLISRTCKELLNERINIRIKKWTEDLKKLHQRYTKAKKTQTLVLGKCKSKPQ